MNENVAVASENPEVTEKKGLSGFAIKMIAVVTMFIDHSAAIILERYMATLGDMSSQQWYAEHIGIYAFYVALRTIGRMAFPIYIFLLVQGFSYTHSKAKYALRLFLFALISEIPFNLAFGYSLWTFQYQNVFWTLLCGFLFMWCADFVYSKDIKPWLGYVGIILNSLIFGGFIGCVIINNAYYYGFDLTAPLSIAIVIVGVAGVIALIEIFVNRKKTFDEFSKAALSLVALGILMWGADLCNTDYGGFGVLAIAVAYAARKNKMKSFALSMIPLIISSFLEAFALVDLVALKFYNGKKGHSMKYFFYAFYPCHILLLYLVAYFLGLC